MLGQFASVAAVVVPLIVTAAAAASDLRTGRIPDALNAMALIVGLGLASLHSVDALATALLAGGSAASALYGVRLLGVTVYNQPGMGWGDVKLGAALGALLGWNALWALYLAAVLGASFGLVSRAMGRTSRLERVPFAPFIAAGTLVATVYGVADLWRDAVFIVGIRL